MVSQTHNKKGSITNKIKSCREKAYHSKSVLKEAASDTDLGEWTNDLGVIWDSAQKRNKLGC